MKKFLILILSDWRRGRCAAGVAGSTAGKRLYWKLSFGLWWDGHPELCTAYAERGNGLSDPGRCSSGTLRRGVSFPAQTVSNDFILECPGVQLYAGAFLIVLFGEFPSMCSVENFLPCAPWRISFHLLTNGSDSYTIALLYNAAIRRLPQWKRTLPPHWKGSRRRP